MKNSKRIVLICFVVCGFFAVPLVYADEAVNPSLENSAFSLKKHQKGENKIKEIYGQLNLTDGQKKELDDNKLKNREQRQAMFEKMRTYKQAINQELMKPGLDMGKINGIQSQLKALESEMIDARLNSVLEVRKILTPEQFVKFISLMQKHKREKSPAEEK